ncbi:MAG: hypothetical protein Q4B54_03555 [Coriobacteriales bacterium]|nr:hypothetical protein [Coriobacteriales bacterium]
MAAKHFAGDVSPSWFEDDPLAGISLRFGRHFKEPEPPSASLETLTEQTDDPSDAVRRYIDQLTAELEYQSRRPVVPSWHSAKIDDEAVVDKSIEQLAESIPQVDETGEDDELVESPLQAETSAEVDAVVRDVAQLNETLPELEDEPEPVSESATEPALVSEAVLEPEPVPVSVTVPEIEPEPVSASESIPEPELKSVPELVPVSPEPLELQYEELPEEELEVATSEKPKLWADDVAGGMQASSDFESFETVEPQPQAEEPVPTATEKLDETLEFPAQVELLTAKPVAEPMEELALDEPDEFESRPAEVPYVEPDLVEEALAGSEQAPEPRRMVPAVPDVLESSAEVDESDTYDELEDTANLKRIEIPVERLAEQHREQRIRVSTNLQEPKPPVVNSTALDKRRHLGFFARIGEFVARLLHLDDR